MFLWSGPVSETHRQALRATWDQNKSTSSDIFSAGFAAGQWKCLIRGGAALLYNLCSVVITTENKVSGIYTWAEFS